MNATTEPKKIVYKIIVIGDANAGKTCLTYRFCEKKFLQTPETTIGVDFRQRIMNIDGEVVTLQLWDTAGLERNRRSMIQHYYRNVDAVIFVYDMTNLKSFDSLKYWIEECESNTFDDTLRIIVGNKCDGNIVVDTNVAQKFADDNNMPLFETSAKLDEQINYIEGMFLTLAHKLKNKKPMMKSRSSIQVGISSQNNEDQASSCYC